MSLGRMYHKITFQQRTTQRSGISNEEKDVWTDVITARAEYLPSRGRETMQGDHPVNVGEDVFRVHYPRNTTITSDMRVYHEGEAKKISSLEQQQRRKYLIVRTQRIE